MFSSPTGIEYGEGLCPRIFFIFSTNYVTAVWRYRNSITTTTTTTTTSTTTCTTTAAVVVVDDGVCTKNVTKYALQVRPICPETP